MKIKYIMKFLSDSLAFIIFIVLESIIELFIMNSNETHMSLLGIKLIKNIFKDGGFNFGISMHFNIKIFMLYIIFLLICVLIRFWNNKRSAKNAI
ncbi:hypothetical protein DY037_01085 [Apilactobacillus micheneri]|uniref:Uncharacterized protein n=1 Tax=Apilactobacillus micheneri TaxID=1899430 RepID=A0A9Q8IMQ9_9LACO|nr:hypothetical protein DY121_03975 [Apilactobacillus micheneri]TPR41813.1 hypothetical protein DY123_04595 [Apilactobacillus micheneri]TPR44204.1 hypothetical protein DY130_03970 [Apilactobacillus micheneri]TPR45828.1 hypothetical protein DY128_03970 [Apilactobacillus micheneri]TPR50572.1 hypothetical protein DY037_01085 [Apilactobacillus micheneri]